MTVRVLWLFLTVLWVGLQCVIVVFPDQTHLFFFQTVIFVIIFLSMNAHTYKFKNILNDVQTI